MFEDQELNEKLSGILPVGYSQEITIEDGKIYLVDGDGEPLPPVDF